MAISVIVLAFSMFGMVGFISSMVSPTPIVKMISSGLTLFSYASIAVLSKRMRFRELFMTLIPLNLINIIRSYVDLGVLVLKYQGSVGELTRLATEYVWLNVDARAANQTVTVELINKTLGVDGVLFVQGLNNTSGASNGLVNSTMNLVSTIPFVSEAWSIINSLPDWVGWGAFTIFCVYALLDSLISIVSNLFACISVPIVAALAAFIAMSFRVNMAYIYVMVGAWIPIAATVDSFLRIYLFRALFFRFMKKHPLITAYSEGGYL